MHVTAPVYEKPSQLSQGLVVGLSIAVVLMAGWLATTIIFSDDPSTDAEGSTDAVANTPVAATSLPADKLPGNAGISPGAAASSSASGQTARSVQFDWPAEFGAKPAPPAQTALPFAPTDLPATHDARHAAWPAVATVPDNARAFAAARRPQPQAGAATSTNATDAIVELLAPPPLSGTKDTAAPARTVPARR